MRICVLLVVLICVSSAQHEPTSPITKPLPPEIWAEEVPDLPVVDDQVEVPAGMRLVTGINEFGFEVLRELVLSGRDDNVFISPTSISMALGMTLAGAAGMTRDAMGISMHLHGMTTDEVNMSFAALLSMLASADPKVRIDVANSVWARKGMAFSESFLQETRDYFEAEASELDFSSSSAPGTINQWVKDRTGGKIPGIIQSIDPDDVLFLINAVYFKGVWTSAFKKELTEETVFHLGTGGTVPVMMMTRRAEFDYYEDPTMQAIRLPYTGGRLAMYVLLPRREEMEEFGVIGEDGEVIAEPGPMPDFGMTVEELVGRLNHHEWTAWLDGFESREGKLAMPRFKMEYDETLNDALMGLGMAEAFDPNTADFSAMFENPGASPAYISQVKHKTFVELDEEGTEAAAATSVGMTLTAMPSGEPFWMIVDRPFCCVIADRKSGAVLFAGVVRDPTRN